MKKAVAYVFVFSISFALGAISGIAISGMNRDGMARAFIEPQPTKSQKPQTILSSKTTAEPKESDPEDETDNSRYLLSLSDDNISVYKVLQNGQTEFLYKKTVDSSALRDEDYTRLCSGIMVYSEKEAIEILEDFIS